MNTLKIINKLTDGLNLRKGFARVQFLIIEKAKLDDGIFNTQGWAGSEYREQIIKMLDEKDIAMSLLDDYFGDYKSNWEDARLRYFEMNEQTEYEKFLKQFEEQIPQDYVSSIKKCKSVSIDKLTKEDSLKIFQKYHEIREWLKEKIKSELANCSLTDKEIFIYANSEKIKFEWKGKAVDLVGLFETLETKDWIVPAGSFREKATCLLKCFTFEKADRTVESVTSIYKKGTNNIKPFNCINKNT
jgi:hypothetical protein